MKAFKENIVCIICIIAGCITASLGVDGWGWFLLLAAIIYGF